MKTVIAQRMAGYYPSLPKSFVISSQQIRVGNLCIANNHPWQLGREVLLHVNQASADDISAVLDFAQAESNTVISLTMQTLSLHSRFNRVLLVSPSNDRNLPKIPPKGVYRIAYHLLTQRQDTDVVIFDPNYWHNKFPGLLERPYDIVGWSSLFSSFVHDAELMTRFNEKYPGIRTALQVLGGMSATDWDPAILFSTGVDLVVKGLGGESAMAQILDTLPYYTISHDLRRFLSLPGIMVKGHSQTYATGPTFPTQEEFSHVIRADYRFVPFSAEHDIIGHHGYFRVQDKPTIPLNEVGQFPLHLLSFQLICQGRCIFCSSQSKHYLKIMKDHGKRPEVKISPEDLIDIIKEAMAQETRIDNLRFDEDNFLFDAKAARRFAELMIENGLSHIPWKIKTRSDHIAKHPELMELLGKAGCYGVDLGFEHGTQRILDLMKKGLTVEDNRTTVEILTQLGYKVIQLNYILFGPDSTKEDLIQTMREMVEYAQKPGVFINLLQYMIALPGAPLMSMPEYQDLITYKPKKLPDGTVINKPSRLKIRDPFIEAVCLEACFDRFSQAIKEYETQQQMKLPEYIYPFIQIRTIYQVLGEKEQTDKYAQEIQRLNDLIEKLTQQTREANK